MPVHDWTRVKAGIFHDFHHEWITTIKHAVNRLLKGTNYYALAEQFAGGWGPDVLTLKLPLASGKKGRKSPASLRVKPGGSPAAVALADSPPQVRYQITDEKKWYAAKKKAVTIRHVSEHEIVAVLEVLSPGNKTSRGALDEFVHKAHSLLRAGIHLALVDLFPPTRRDPEGIHPLLWGDEDDDPFRFDPAKPLTCASYVGGPLARAFVEPVGVGDALPNLPLFLVSDEYVPVPLEETYQAAFEAVPDFWREVLTTPNGAKR
jgi:hypothetical protein